MKSDSERRVQWTALLSLSNVYNDRNGNDGGFLLSVEGSGSDHAENGEIKDGEVQIVYIDFHKNGVSLSGDQSVSALRAWRISH